MARPPGWLDDGRPPSEVGIANIIAATAHAFGVSADDLRGPSRRRNLVNARQVAMAVCRRLTAASLVLIARQFGDRDHTTVVHAVRRVEQVPELAAYADRLVEELLHPAPAAAPGPLPVHEHRAHQRPRSAAPPARSCGWHR